MKPLILAIDTTHEFGSMALAAGGAVMAEVALHEPAGFAHVLYGHLSTLLEQGGVTLAEVDCFAASSGPGSFTGVRIGLACIKGLAEAEGKPAVAVSNLRALATFAGGPLRAAVMDARRGEVYGAVYDAAGTEVSPEIVAPFDKWLAGLPEGDLEFVTGDIEVPLAATRFEGARVTRAPQSLAAAIARLATTAYARGEATDPAHLDANYVRRSDAELFWKEV